MYYKVLGKDTPDADTLVLSSGLGGVHGFWQPQLAMLAEHFRVVVYDQHGTGASQGTVPAGYRMEDMADELPVYSTNGISSVVTWWDMRSAGLSACILQGVTRRCCKVWW